MTKAFGVELILGVLLGTLAIAIGVALALRARRARSRAELDALARSVGARVVDALAIPGSKRPAPGFEIDEAGARALVYLRSTVTRDAVSVLVPCSPLPRVTVRRPLLADRLGRWTGLDHQAKTSDGELERRAYVETEEPENLLRGALDPPDIRAAVLDALDAFDSVKFGDGGVTGTLCLSRRPLRAARERQWLDLLRKLAAAAPEVALDPSRRRRSARGDHAWLATAVIAAFGYGCFVFLPRVRADLWSPMWSEDMLTGQLLAIAIAIAMAIASYAWLRGHMRSLRNFVRVNVFVALAAPIPAPVAMYWCNAVFDRSPPDVHLVLVVGKNRGEGVLLRHRVTFRVWDRPQYKKTVSTSRDFFESVELNGWILVTTREGAFGWEWVESVQKPEMGGRPELGAVQAPPFPRPWRR
jgi:hypothetical protein